MSSAVKRILLVDDDPQVAESVQRVLSELGAQVTVARTAAEAIACIAEAGPFEVMITDHRMPGMTGEALVAQVGPALAAAGTAVYVMSGWYDVAGTDSTHDIGGTRVRLLAKPIAAQDLERIARS